MTAAPLAPAVGLDPQARELLDFERVRATLPGPGGREIRERFGLSATRYHQRLNLIIDLPEALAYDAALVRRLRRLREERRGLRSSGRLR